jgi:MGT family glycosyltransferase
MTMTNEKKKFLLTTWEGGGVIPPELGIAKRLVARGHEVRILADPSVEPAARASGCAFSPWVRAPHKRSLAPEEDIVRDWEYSNLLKLFEHILEVFICGPVQKFVDDTTEVLDRHPVDAVLSDFMLLGPMMVAEARKLPCVGLVPNIYLRPTKGIPPFGPGFMPATGPLGRLRDALMRWMSTRLWRKGLPPVNRARAALALDAVNEFWAQYDRIDRVLVLTSRAFDFEPADALPPNVTYAGAVLDDPEWAGGSWTPPWPSDAKDPLVLVGLSSTFQDQEAVLSRVIDAVAKLPVRALVTLGPALEEGAVRSPSPNVVCVRTAPHGLVLPHASAVVTHCGHGTTIRSLAAGVPLVCIPMGRDQNDTAARVVARGAGIRLSPKATPEKVRAAVERVLRDPDLRAGAQRMKAAIASEGRSIDIVGEIEKVAGVKARSDAREAADSSPLWQPSAPPMATMR